MDQDDSMLSSPSSQNDETYEEENLFPESGGRHHRQTPGGSSGADFLARPQTPQNDHLNAAAPGELSPPRSQSVTTTTGTAIDDGIVTSGVATTTGNRFKMMGSGGDDSEDLSPTAANRTMLPSSSSGIGTGGGGGGGGGIGVGAGADNSNGSSRDEEWRPGLGWKSKKAQEDMQRAWDSVVDKEFSLKEFGDVMAHRLTN